MSKKVPEILYKYRAFNPRTLEMLAKNQIYFASPNDFNDPFDCLAHEGMVEDFRKGMDEIIAEEAARRGLTNEEIENHLERINHDVGMIEARKEADADFQRGLDFVKNEMGIVSLSSCNNSILMWSHYGDFHKGFCIGYKDNLNVPVDAVHEVEYSSSVDRGFLLNFFLSGGDKNGFLAEIHKIIVLTKFLDWEYENEWRIMGVKGVGTYEESSVCEIIFGLKMPQENREVVVSMLRGRNVNYFEAVKSKNDFSIDIVHFAVTNS